MIHVSCNFNIILIIETVILWFWYLNENEIFGLLSARLAFSVIPFWFSIKCISLNSLYKRKILVPTVRVGTHWIQYYTSIVHSKCSALIFLFLKNHCKGLFLMEVRKCRLSWQWGRIKSIKTKYLLILKGCNLHSRLCSPLLYFSVSLYLHGFSPPRLILHNFTTSFFFLYFHSFFTILFYLF